jgi:hypothetical protein
MSKNTNKAKRKKGKKKPKEKGVKTKQKKEKKEEKMSKVIRWHREAKKWENSQVVARETRVGSARTARRLRLEALGPIKAVRRVMTRRARQRQLRIRVEDLDVVAKNGLCLKKKK